MFSVLLPVYNNKDDIYNSILSVLRQSYKDFELIICDDCSTDGTYELLLDIVKKYTLKYNFDIKLIRNETNKGVYISLNECLKIAKRKYIVRIDSDDKLDKDLLKINYEIFTNNPKLIVNRFKIIKGKVIRYGEISMVYKRSLIKSIGYYDSVRFSGDAEFTRRILAVLEDKYINYYDKILYYVKHRENSLTTNNITGCSGDGLKIRLKYRKNAIKWHKTARPLYMPYPLDENNRPFEIHDLQKP